MALRIVPLGGLGEIGMNCMVLEYGEDILIIDCGLMFSDLDHFGVEYAIPNFQYLLERRDRIRGFVITHGHEDHIGALPIAVRLGLNAPIYCSEFSSRLISHRLEDEGLKAENQIRVFQMGETFSLGCFKIQTTPVNHSIVDAAALLIETPLGRVIHTGDFKIDPMPFYGSELDLGVFKKAGDSGVLLLMSDSTNVERHAHSVSDNAVYQSFEQLFAVAEGLTVVAMFSSNVGRLGQIFEIAAKQGRKVALSGRSMIQNAEFGKAVGYLKDADSVLISLDDLSAYPRDKVIVVSTGSQGEPRSSLVKLARGEHPVLELEQGDRILMSSRMIPGNERPISRMINELFKQGADVIYDSVHEIHASGHATRPELKKMIEAVRPRYFLPIHGEYRHLVHHADLAADCGLKDEQVLVACNGDVLEIDGDQFEIVEQLSDPKILVEDRQGTEVTASVLKARRQLGEKGVVFALVSRSAESGRVIGGPEVIAQGLASEERAAQWLADARRVAQRVVKAYEGRLDRQGERSELDEDLRVELRRFFFDRAGKKPTVIPYLLDV